MNLKELTQMADDNNVEALVDLGYKYLYGEDVEANINKAIYYFKKAAEFNSPEALCFLGSIYEEHDSELYDVDKAVYYYEKLMEFDKPYALYCLGRVYNDSKGKLYDINKAIDYFQKSCDLECPEAFFQLGACYFWGMGNLSQDFNKAVNLYKNGADLGDETAQMALAEYYRENGSNTDSLHYYEMAAKQENVFAMRKIGEMYLDGCGGNIDECKAFEYIKKASQYNDLESKRLLAEMYDRGIGTAKNESKALELWKELYNSNSPLKNDTMVIFNIAFDYHEKKQYNDAFKLFKELAMKEKPVAQYFLGWYYANQKGMENMNKKEALLQARSWLEKAIDNGYTNPKVYALLDSVNTKLQQKGCYVATAVYGSYDCPPVWTLRRYRDKVLQLSGLGRVFIKIYYFTSPKILRVFGKQKWFNFICKTILDSIVEKLNKKGFKDTEYKD